MEEDKWLIKQDTLAETSQILDYLNKRLGTDVKLQYPFRVILMKNILFFAIFLGLVFLLKYIRIALL